MGNPFGNLPVGGRYASGTTVLIEDVAFHIENLPEATADLADLLEKFGFDDACIYGHALEGNYHFVISQSFDTKEKVDRYRTLMQEVEHLVVDKYDGSLKAEPAATWLRLSSWSGARRRST